MTTTPNDHTPGRGERPTIVVGYDGSKTARAAVAYARRRAGAAGRLVVVHAYALPAELLGFPNYDRLLEERQRRGRALLEEVAPEGTTPGWKASSSAARRRRRSPMSRAFATQTRSSSAPVA